LRAYFQSMPKLIEIPPEAARSFVDGMRAFFRRG
jgi:hypothetical protein